MTDFACDLAAAAIEDRHYGLHDSDHDPDPDCSLCADIRRSRIEEHPTEHTSDVVMDCPICVEEWKEITNGRIA